MRDYITQPTLGLIFLPVEEMSHAVGEHGNVTVLSCSVLSFVFSSFFFMQIHKNFLHFLLLIMSSPRPLSFSFNLSYLIFPIFPLSFPPLCFCQASPSQSVVATCRSETSPRATVGLTTWRSASAGDAVCRGLMSS